MIAASFNEAMPSITSPSDRIVSPRRCRRALHRDNRFCKRRLALLRMLEILMGLLLGLAIWPEVDATALGLESIVCHHSEIGFEASPRTRRRRPNWTIANCPAGCGNCFTPPLRAVFSSATPIT